MGSAMTPGAEGMGRTGTASGGWANTGNAARTGPSRAGRRATPEPRPSKPEGLNNFLGWFSLGLGAAEVLAPGLVARIIGANDTPKVRTTLRVMGLREMTSGLGILGDKPREGAWLWGRVAGDALDVALLGRVLADDDSRRAATTFAIANVLGVAALDVLAAQKTTNAVGLVDDEANLIETKRAITVRKPVEEVYGFWRDFANLPRFMRHLESVQVLDDRRSHWVAKAPAGKTVEWDAIMTEDVPNERIAWRAAEGSDVYNEGVVTFTPAPGGRGTEVRVDLRYDPPGGVIASKVAMLFREEPGQQAQDDLRRFKQVLETGDVVTSDATVTKGPHSAQPPAFRVSPAAVHAGDA